MKRILQTIPWLFILLMAWALQVNAQNEGKAAPPLAPPTLFMLVSQNGTSPPTATIITNTLPGGPAPVFTRIAPGLYNITLTGQITEGTYYAATSRYRITEMRQFPMTRSGNDLLVLASFRTFPANPPGAPVIVMADGLLEQTPIIIQQWD